MQLFDLQPWQFGQVPKKTVRKELAALSTCECLQAWLLSCP